MAKKNSNEDSFVDSVIGNPKSPRKTMLFSGYAGTSFRSGYMRIYFDLVFQSYVDIKSTDIYGKKTVSVNQGPLDKTFVWVSTDADVKWHMSRHNINVFPVTEIGCPPQTIHSDCPTPTFNVPGCGNTFGPQCGGGTETPECGPTNFGCGETDVGCGQGVAAHGQQRKYRRIW